MEPGDSELVQFKSDAARRVFDSLVDSFIDDYMVKKYVAEKSGWRTLSEIAERSRISQSVLYGKNSALGAVFDEPLRRGLIERRIFPGERGRGGEVTRLRISYDKEPIREYVNTKVRLGRGPTGNEQTASMLRQAQSTNQEKLQTTLAIEGGRKLAAIMFTDIAGFTSMTQKDEPSALRLLAKHNELVHPIFAKHGGTEIKTIGDSFLAEFGSALEATNCAVEIQQVLREYNIDSNVKLLVRVGIHVGDVVHQKGDVYGDAVNIASRMDRLVEGGEICISEQVYDQVRNKVPFRLVKLASPEMKNVTIPIGAYKLELPWEKEEEGSSRFDRRRLAILPFANISPDPNDEYFADGMTEELISTMSKAGGLQVIARSSVLRYKGSNKNIEEIGRELKVGSVLEGSVRKAGDRIRITAQLIDSIDSRHLWSENYDRELKDVFAIQSDIARTVADSLKVRLLEEEKLSIEKEPTKNTEAHLMCLKGIYYNANASSSKDLFRAKKYFEGAVTLDPSFAPAYSWLGDCYATLAQAGFIRPEEAIPKAENAIKKALELDPGQADAHRAQGFLLLVSREMDWKGAERETKRALELNPNVAMGHESYSWMLALEGRFDEALVEANRALELDPLSTAAHCSLAMVLYYQKEFDRAIDQLKKAREFDTHHRAIGIQLGLCYIGKSKFEDAIKEFGEMLEPAKGKADLGLFYLALACARAGRRDEARKILNDFKEISKTQFIPALAIAPIHAALDERDDAIQVLERAYADGDCSSLLDLKVSPIWDGIRSDPGFLALLEKIGYEGAR